MAICTKRERFFQHGEKEGEEGEKCLKVGLSGGSVNLRCRRSSQKKK